MRQWDRGRVGKPSRLGFSAAEAQSEPRDHPKRSAEPEPAWFLRQCVPLVLHNQLSNNVSMTWVTDGIPSPHVRRLDCSTNRRLNVVHKGVFD